MDVTVRGFLRSAMVWLAVGMGFGIWMAMHPAEAYRLRLVHMHALLPGFVLFMIFGVGYHIFPRFSGKMPPWSRGPLTHLIVANVGLVLMVAGLYFRLAWDPARWLLVGGGTLVLAGALIFAHAVWHFTEAPKWPMTPARPNPPSTKP